MSHGNEMICQLVTLSGYAEWPKVADAVIEAGWDQGDRQGDRILNFQQSQQGAALVDDSRADNEITLKSPIYVVTGD
jgi:hypothetical protein